MVGSEATRISGLLSGDVVVIMLLLTIVDTRLPFIRLLLPFPAVIMPLADDDDDAAAEA